jgi:ABC-type Na+ efflux pump permease subunit
MRTRLNFEKPLVFLLVLVASFGWQNVLAAETNAAPQRIGIYDSRAIAYAHFWSEAHQREINELVKAAKEARAAGHTERFKELDAALKKEQEQNHLQVFSTAPVDDVLAEMKDRLAEIQKEAGVARLVSKWDSKTLKEHQRAERLDVTDRLLREFNLSEKQMKVAKEIQTKPPLPLDKARKLTREGKL